SALFVDGHSHFQWHPEMMFKDAEMQTHYLKDLVTPVNPTSAYSYLNYLAQNQMFYSFLNTQRSHLTRREFELYGQWVAHQLGSLLKFNTKAEEVHFNETSQSFEIQTTQGIFESKNLCIATGLSPRVPTFAKHHLGPNVFHAKSGHLKNLNLEGKSVAIIGGGQTGVEVFRNTVKGTWGNPSEVRLVTRRKNLEPLDESAFINEYFTPQYVDDFWNLSQKKKEQIVNDQKLASDGNTPTYLLDLYRDLYQLKIVEKDPRPVEILAFRTLQDLRPSHDSYQLKFLNQFQDQVEELKVDKVILCTGFQTQTPKILAPLLDRIPRDEEGRFHFKKSYSIEWEGPENRKIYALNFSRHNHGIMDPQMSLMAWRSAVVINDLVGHEVYQTQSPTQNFVTYQDLQ
ncbi:MAG: SidA/IucD/PvdA family monooxygenase, partial [Bdellovibrionales bacterium]|nr:SidA/IucD/PvdA family monooxygenase [Bdellovibrionales bacterium]